MDNLSEIMKKIDEIVETVEKMEQVSDIVNKIDDSALMLSLINTVIDSWCSEKNYSPKEMYQRIYTSAAVINGFVEGV